MNRHEQLKRSEELQDILSSPPNSLIRIGSSVICGILVVIICGSFLFKYPDVVISDATITQKNPPTWIISKAAGKIKELYVKDHDNIKKNEIIAVIENPAITK